MDNSKAFDAGIKKAKQIVSGYVFDCLAKVCEQLADDAVKNYRSPIGAFTGNTITGYACGLYVNGALTYYYSNGDKMKSPVRVKLSKGETDYLSPDYGGRNRRFTGTVDTDKGFGKDFSFKYLSRYKSKAKNGFEIVVCSGTEYSSYIENVWHGNVLTDTFERAPNILAKNFKPMKL
jgi:hypothetical protein|nr:MAG TPA: hypothetical protein [Caudoviricetes sp.]DAN49066.1 MAG TPA: hypothetical protein [Caudoviricetes sp.]